MLPIIIPEYICPPEVDIRANIEGFIDDQCECAWALMFVDMMSAWVTHIGTRPSLISAKATVLDHGEAHRQRVLQTVAQLVGPAVLDSSRVGTASLLGFAGVLLHDLGFALEPYPMYPDLTARDADEADLGMICHTHHRIIGRYLLSVALGNMPAFMHKWIGRALPAKKERAHFIEFAKRLCACLSVIVANHKGTEEDIEQQVNETLNVAHITQYLPGHSQVGN